MLCIARVDLSDVSQRVTHLKQVILREEHASGDLVLKRLSELLQLDIVFGIPRAVVAFKPLKVANWNICRAPEDKKAKRTRKSFDLTQPKRFTFCSVAVAVETR